jgi:sulfur transfer complex TusBCD TusB component (DsrH family)
MKRQRYIAYSIMSAIDSGTQVFASTKDLQARAISKEYVEKGIMILENLEEVFVEDVMENSQRVISW